jgi:iron complex outermembrane receptor protein
MRVNSSTASAQTTVYADGLLLSNFLNNSFSTAPRWGMVSPDEIDRVEVLYGPFSALYPGNSAGGVVRMSTRTPTQFEAHVKLDLFGQRYKEYGTDGNFAGGHASASLGDALNGLSYLITLDHLDNHGHPQTFGNATAKSGAPAAAGTYTVVDSANVIRDIDTAGKPRIIVSSTGIDHTVQDIAKLNLGWRLSPLLSASYTLGIWRMLPRRRRQLPARRRRVWNAGSAFANPFKFVRIDGADYRCPPPRPAAAAASTGCMGWHCDPPRRRLGWKWWPVCTTRRRTCPARPCPPTASTPAWAPCGPVAS